MGGRYRMLVVGVVVIAAAAIAFALVDGRHNDIRRKAFAGRAPMPGPNPGGSSQRAVVIKPASVTQIGRQITAGSHVDVWVATTGHGSNKLRTLDRHMEVLGTSPSAGRVTLRATLQQAGKLVYASANDRLVVRLHR